MKNIVIAFTGILFVSFVALAQVKKPSGSPFDPIWPQTGMTVSDLEKALSEIKTLMPTGPGQFESHPTVHTNVLYLEIPNTDTIRVTTGRGSGPRAGRGRKLEFRKIDGKWKLSAESDWFS